MSHKVNEELRQKVMCTVGECLAEHEGCLYDPKDESASRTTPQTDKIIQLFKSHSEAYAAEKVRSSCNGCGSDTTYCSNCERLLQS